MQINYLNQGLQLADSNSDYNSMTQSTDLNHSILLKIKLSCDLYWQTILLNVSVSENLEQTFYPSYRL